MARGTHDIVADICGSHVMQGDMQALFGGLVCMLA